MGNNTYKRDFMSEEENNENIQNMATDVADRLILLMRRIEYSDQELRFEIHNNANNYHSGLQRPLHEVFEPLAEDLGFFDYSELRDNFTGLCKRVIRDIESLNLKKPETQQRWINAVKKIADVFNASNFPKSCSSVFGEHFSNELYERLEDASERLQDVGREEATQDQLKESLDAAREAMNVYEKNGKISSELNKVLKHYLQQIEEAYQRYNDFGEDAFWTTYKNLFATFMQVHPAIMPKDKSDDAKEAVKIALNNMHGKMYYGLRALSVSADLATLAASGAALLALA